MQLQKLNSGLIYTKSNCIGCNKCISGCIAIGANVVVKAEKSDHYSVKVDPNKCILCGHCISECVHNARTYRDDTDEFFDALERGEQISVIVASSLLTDYQNSYNHILGYLKQIGVNHIYNASFGADIMIWVYINFIQQFGLAGVISQNCPVIVNYLEKYKPELLSYLMPVQSPMMCTAIYASDYLKITDKLAYIGPCIAQKYEMDDVNTYGKVSYSITFDRLMERIAKEDVTKYYAEDEVEYGMGALISKAGGLTANLELYIGFEEVLIQTTGYQNIFPYFANYYKEVANKSELPFLVDALNCVDGCNFGTATSCGVEQRNQVDFSQHRSKERAYRSRFVQGRDHKERLNTLNERFRDFELSSFVRQYDQTRKIDSEELSEEAFDGIFKSMFKDSPQKCHVDCGACGYTTCKDMAHAIGTQVNRKENCINYSKECISRETKKTNELLEAISSMNEELKESAQLKSNFLANMSHEIRTPMNAVIGMAEMALRGELPDEERGYIQQIKSSGRSLLAIINDILDFSKIESGKMEIIGSEYAVMSIINDTVNMLMSRIGEKAITLLVEADPTIPFKLFGDDIRIKQILINLANNAIKFTESGCVGISMQYRREGNDLQLIVAIKDTGIGIKPDDLKKLFSTFQQVDSKRNRNIEGTGLGLAISKEFVSLMGGEIEVESEYGKGSTFRFIIPQKIVEDAPSAVLKEKKTVKTASFIGNSYVREGYEKAIAKFDIIDTPCSSLEGLRTAALAGAEYIFVDYMLWDESQYHPEEVNGYNIVVIVDPRKDILAVHNIRRINQPVYSLSIAAILNNESMTAYARGSNTDSIVFEAPEARVLIVDDNAINLTVANGLLGPFHMKITLSSSAREAIEYIDNNQYDIVFMDHMMPDMDGVEATHVIRSREGDYYQNLPIIALTANAINNAKDMFVREGMNDFVAKPIDMLDITAILKKWLPQEKIKKSTGPKEEVSEAETNQEFKIEGLDVAAGIALSGTAELYKRILGEYHAVIVKKSALIEKYEAEDQIAAYTIEVHALKSASKLIGATELSDMAAQLEKCGNEKNLAVIKSDTAALLRKYRSYLLILDPYRKMEEQMEEREVTAEELLGQLNLIYEALDDFNLDGAVFVVKQVKGYCLDDRARELRRRLSEALDEFEYDEAIAVVEEWKEYMEEGGL